MRLLRFGPSLVFVRGSDIEELSDFIGKFFGVQKIPMSEALKISQGFQTIIIPSSSDEWKTVIKSGEQSTFLVKMQCDSVLKELFNAKIPADRINLGPHILVFRVVKNTEAIKRILMERYGGKEVSLIEGIDAGEEKDTLLVLTTKKITEPVGFEDIEATLLFRKNFVELYRILSRDVPLIMYKALPEGWRDITIRIYDTSKRYDENVERVLLVLEDLELGYVINEGWDWDYPRPLMRVKVYKIKLLSWEDPLRIKFLLKGLEYIGYKRLVDIDVFTENNKKISWSKVAGKFNSKFELAKAARKELERLLSEDVKRKLYEIEAKLLQGGAHQQK